MKNLYVFAIGGSGERVLKSLIMILSAGVQLKAQKLIPVFIENDEKSDALDQCLKLIQYYNSEPARTEKIGANTSNRQFSNNPDDWGDFFKTIISDPIILKKDGGAIGNLQNVIGPIDEKNPYATSLNQELNLLFSKNDLKMPLNVGFIGNPNIGSIVLNTLSLQDRNFQNILTEIQSDDGVIVIGSLYGGTGAAGIPLIINTFNNLDFTHKPIIGAGCILPYFTFDKTDHTNIVDTKVWDVDSDTFDVKTRAALMYYDSYMCKTNNLDYMYYAGDDTKDAYEHNVGGSDQKNPSHIVEMLMALSIVDFSAQKSTQSTTYKRPILRVNDNGDIINIDGITNKELKKALVKFQLTKIIFENENFLKFAINQKAPFVNDIGFTENIRQAVINDSQQFPHCYGINHIFKEWDQWLKELSRDKAKRKFLLYDRNKQATPDNVLTNFFAEGEFGIALTEEHGTGFLGFGNKKLLPVKAEVLEALRSSYKNQKEIYSSKNISEKTVLPALLKIISDALDSILQSKSTLCDVN